MKGRLTNKLEMVYQEIKDASLTPNVHSYSTLIVGYVATWMWDKMESTFKNMEASSGKRLCAFKTNEENGGMLPTRRPGIFHSMSIYFHRLQTKS
jgi:pentatricopeptide repeat protein